MVGIPDDWSGELPKAFVVLKTGVAKNQKTGRELMKYVEDNKIRYKWLKEIELVDEVPKSASGKILKKNLRNESNAPRGLVVQRAEKARSAKL